MKYLTAQPTEESCHEFFEAFDVNGVGRDLSNNRPVYHRKSIPYDKQYLTFVAREAGTFKFSGSTTSNTLQYSLDNGETWTTLAHNTNSPTVACGGTIMWKASGLTIDDESYEPGIGRFRSSGAFDVKGNVMSLLYGDNFIGEVNLENKENAFSMLFDRCSGVTSANGLSLPATALSEYCYYAMFRGCSSLTDSMQTLPATTLASDCYCEMFGDCSALTTTPELPATTLDDSCYAEMFEGCSSLTSAPELPATSLATHCYRHMFGYCTNLTNAPTLGLTALTETYCYFGMFRACTSLVNAPALPATILSNGCYDSMFAGCTSIVSAPALPATELAVYCYNCMFRDCTSLVNAPALPATNLSGATNCYAHMFSGCTSLVNAPALPATTLANSAYSNMFISCTALTHAPVLSAETLATSCYTGMFSGCSSLSSITCLATDISATDCTKNWVAGVSGNGVFMKANEMTGWTIDSVSGVPVGWTVQDVHNYSDMYLTFRAQGSGTFKFSGSSASNTIQYSLDNGGTWQTLAHNTSSPTVQSGDTIMFKASGLTISSTLGIGHFISTGQFRAEGNVMSLVFGDDFEGQTSLSGKDTVFAYLFGGCTGLTSAENLSLPATTLSQQCYQQMFFNCSNLADAPELPAETLSIGCYYLMFNGTKITKAPVLPASALTQYCYQEMFRNCTGLTTAPTLPAATLEDYCYQAMFCGCTSLNRIECYATDISATDCTDDWVKNVASDGTFVEASTMSSWTRGVDGIPVNWRIEGGEHDYSQDYLTFVARESGTFAYGRESGQQAAMLSYSLDDGETWTSLDPKTNTPTVASGDSILWKGTELATSGYVWFYSSGEFDAQGNIMSLAYGDNFTGVTTISRSYMLEYIFYESYVVSAENLILPATTLADYCYEEMFYGCTSLTSVPSVLPATTLANYCYYNMFYDCTSLTTAPELPATTLAYNCYDGMFVGCTSLTTAPELPATTLADNCYDNMFDGCTSLTTAPELPATTLADSCYRYMFYGCTNLNYIKCLATDISATDCTTNWLYSVAASGTFVRPASMSGVWPSGASGIPTGWTEEDV